MLHFLKKIQKFATKLEVRFTKSDSIFSTTFFSIREAFYFYGNYEGVSISKFSRGGRAAANFFCQLTLVAATPKKTLRFSSDIYVIILFLLTPIKIKKSFAATRLRRNRHSPTMNQ